MRVAVTGIPGRSESPYVGSMRAAGKFPATYVPSLLWGGDDMQNKTSRGTSGSVDEPPMDLWLQVMT